MFVATKPPKQGENNFILRIIFKRERECEIRRERERERVNSFIQWKIITNQTHYPRVLLYQGRGGGSNTPPPSYK